MSESSKMEKSYYSEFGIDFEGGIDRLMGEKEFYISLLKELYTEYSSYTEVIKEAVKEGKKDVVTKTAHTLKGVSGNLCAKEIQRISLALETANKLNLIERNEELIKELENAFCRLGEFIKKIEISGITTADIIQGFPAETDKAEADKAEADKAEADKAEDGIAEDGIAGTGKLGVDQNKKLLKIAITEKVNPEEVVPEIVQKMFLSLAEQVWEDNIESRDSIKKLKRYIGDYSYKDDIQKLDYHINNFDFEVAKEYIRKIAHLLNLELEVDKNG